MRGTLAGEKVAEQKLAAFERLQPECEASYRFMHEVHRQRRFATLPVAEMVHYLHALWICECKDLIDRPRKLFPSLTHFSVPMILTSLEAHRTQRERKVGYSSTNIT
ncbi:MAG: hypothetical protein E6I97_06720 [Chloroflexi bacterium]|nr:MAG: hypothetical protein E6I97_06720 [Chloroflexota bacterium]